MRRISPLLKLIGIALFIGIITRLDRNNIALYVLKGNIILLLTAQCTLFGVLGIKSLRWHTLAEAAGAKRQKNVSWREFMIGVFLSTFTPAKLGDFGKVAYLKSGGVGAKTAALLVIIERMADIIVLVPLAIVGAGILAQNQGVIIGTLGLIGVIALVSLLSRFWKTFAAALRYCLGHHALSSVLLTTMGGWALHFLWAIVIARSLGIVTSIPVLVAALTGASFLNALPIAPSGLGTREAALLTLLAPYNIEPEHIVALALLMFVQLLIAAIPGGYYWIHTKTPKTADSRAEHTQDTSTLLS